jgi:murein L,D-transpeptidase YcbB/YkuD
MPAYYRAPWGVDPATHAAWRIRHVGTIGGGRDNASMSVWRIGLALGLLLSLGVALAGEAEGPWFSDGRPTPLARQAVQLLADAQSHGLDSRDYAVATLVRDIEAAGTGVPPDAATRARIHQALDSAMRRYLGDLHVGRVDPRELHSRYAVSAQPPFDAAGLLREAASQGDLRIAVQHAVPKLPLYERLRDALTRYRSLAAHTAWLQALPPLPPAGAAQGKLEQGQAWTGLALLQQRLIALGDLPGAQAGDVPVVFDAALAQAVRAFQQRHGLLPDGVIGAATWRALQIAPAVRVRQLELALERLRWTPLLAHARTIVVNVPEFVLRAYEVRGGRVDVQRTMKVVVGKALDTRTPLIEAELRFVEFSPYWNVPPSIARHEVVPLLRRNPAAWTRDGYEFVDGAGQVDSAYARTKLDAVLAGELRIRQRPGPRNPLGDIKFVFPNQEQVYLHHTSSARLFERERRDFSHGCIRVEHPVELATFVLQGMPAWNESRIREAMARGTSATLAVAQPVHVLIAYGTALVKEGRVFFFDDVYGLDAQLDAALRRLALARQTMRP